MYSLIYLLFYKNYVFIKLLNPMYNIIIGRRVFWVSQTWGHLVKKVTNCLFCRIFLEIFVQGRDLEGSVSLWSKWLVCKQPWEVEIVSPLVQRVGMLTVQYDEHNISLKIECAFDYCETVRFPQPRGPLL